MNNSSSVTKSNKTPKAPVENFFEALKDQGKAASVGLGKSLWEQLSGSLPPANQNETPFNFQEYLESETEKIRQQEKILRERQTQTEVLIFHRREEICKREIEIIKQEIKALVVQTGKLSSELVEAEKTVSGRTPDIKSGVYYFSFFERIRRLIKLAKKRISESRTWLQEFSNRNKAKSYYWAQFTKSGTKFSLSTERYLATSAG